MRIPASYVAGLACLCLLDLAPGQVPQLLKDLNVRSRRTVNLGSEFTPLGVMPTKPPTLLFSAWTEATGRELWATTGESTNTKMLADHVKGPGSSDPGEVVTLPDGTAVLAMTHPQLGRELHRVPSSISAGPSLIEDENPGPEGFRISNLALFGGKAFCILQRPAPAGRYDVILAQTDGKTVSEVKRLGSAPEQDPQLTVFGTNLVMAVDDGKTGVEVWKSDGTANGTQLVQDLRSGPGGSYPHRFAQFINRLYFSADNGKTGRELFQYDGKAIGLVADIQGGTGGSDPDSLVPVGDLLYFSADDGKSGRELWRVDKKGQTSQVADLKPGAGGSDPQLLSVVGTMLLFAAAGADGNGKDTGREPWVVPFANGKPGLLDLNPGAGSSDPSSFLPLNGKFYFAADNGTDGRQLHETDGTTAGTKQRTKIAGGADPQKLIEVGGKILLSAGDGKVSDEVFRFDLVAGLVSLGDLNPATPQTTSSGGIGSNFVYLDGFTYFLANDGTASGNELWRTDGTRAGTKRVTSVSGQVTFGSEPMVTLDGKILFTASSAATGAEPYTFDPRTGKVSLLMDTWPGSNGYSLKGYSEPMVLGASKRPVVLFRTNDGTTGIEPWITDGTFQGTYRLVDIRQGPGGSGVSEFAQLKGGIAVFAANNGTHGTELWRTDGSSAGTVMVTDVNPRGNGIFIFNKPAVLAGVVYFEGNDPRYNRELFRSDGTASGTSLVKDIEPGANRGSNPSELTVLGDKIYFGATTTGKGDELWASDGTAAGTSLVADILPGFESSNPNRLVAAGNQLFFVATLTGPTLWVLRPSKGLLRLPEPENPKLLVPHGNKLYFTGEDNSSGREYWVSDGTREGTRLAADIHRGPIGSQILVLYSSGGQVYMMANDGVHGTEPFVVPSPGASATPNGTPCPGPRKDKKVGFLPSMRATPPTLGDTMRVAGSEAPANHAGLVVLGVPPTNPIDLGNGCRTAVDLTVFAIMHSFTPNSQGKWSYDLPVPNQGAFAGFGPLAMWTVFLAPGSLFATNGLLLRVDRR